MSKQQTLFDDSTKSNKVPPKVVPMQWRAVHTDDYLSKKEGFTTKVALALREIVHNGITYNARQFWCYNVRRIDGTNVAREYVLIAHDGEAFSDIDDIGNGLELGLSSDGVQGHGMKASAFYLLPKDKAELIVVSREKKQRFIGKRLFADDKGLIQEEVDANGWIDFLAKNLSYIDKKTEKARDLNFTGKANVFVLMRYDKKYNLGGNEGAERDGGAITVAVVNTLMRICRAANKPDVQIEAAVTKVFGDKIPSGNDGEGNEDEMYGGECKIRVLPASEYDEKFSVAKHREVVTGIRYKSMTCDVAVEMTHYPCVIDGGNTMLQLDARGDGTFAHVIGFPPVSCGISGDFRFEKDDAARLREDFIHFVAHARVSAQGPRWNSSFCDTLGIKHDVNRHAARTPEEVQQVFGIKKQRDVNGRSKLSHRPTTTFAFHVIPTPDCQGHQVFGEVSHVFYVNTGLANAREFTKMVIEKLAGEMDAGKRPALRNWIAELNEKFFPKRVVDNRLPSIALNKLKDERPRLELEAAEDLYDAGKRVYDGGKIVGKIPAPYKRDIHWRVFVRHAGKSEYVNGEIVDSSRPGGVVHWNGMSLRRVPDEEIDGKSVYNLEISRVRILPKDATSYQSPANDEEYVALRKQHKTAKVTPGSLFNVQLSDDIKIYHVNIVVQLPSLESSPVSKETSRGAPKATTGETRPYAEYTAYPMVFGMPERNQLILNLCNRQIKELAAFADDETLRQKLQAEWIKLYSALQIAMSRWEDSMATLRPLDAKDEYKEQWEAMFGDNPEYVGLLNHTLRMIVELHPSAVKIRKALKKESREMDALLEEQYGVAKDGGTPAQVSEEVLTAA